MSLADGNNFNAKCHLPMIAPFAAAARKKTLSSFQGPDSDQTVLYVLLHPFPLELGISDQFWAPPSARQAFFWQKAKAAWASIPRWPFTGPRHPFTFRWRQGAPAPSALNWALGRGPFQCLPSHYTPLCTGGSSLLVSPLWIPSAHRGEGSCPPCSHHQSSTAQAHGGYSIIRTEQMKNNRMKEERNQAPHREGKEHFCYFPHCSGPGFGRRLPHHTPTSLPPPPPQTPSSPGARDHLTLLALELSTQNAHLHPWKSCVSFHPHSKDTCQGGQNCKMPPQIPLPNNSNTKLGVAVRNAARVFKVPNH